jgi:hypothetical protein
MTSTEQLRLRADVADEAILGLMQDIRDVVAGVDLATTALCNALNRALVDGDLSYVPPRFSEVIKDLTNLLETYQ